jgi:hypothetical protein
MRSAPSFLKTKPAHLRLIDLPYDLVMKTMDTPGKIALELWLQWRLEGCRTFRFCYGRLGEWWGIRPWTIRRVLRTLEQRGCISVSRRPGARAVITIRGDLMEV